MTAATHGAANADAAAAAPPAAELIGTLGNRRFLRCQTGDKDVPHELRDMLPLASWGYETGTLVTADGRKAILFVEASSAQVPETILKEASLRPTQRLFPVATQ